MSKEAKSDARPELQKPTVCRIVKYFDNSVRPHPAVVTSVPDVPGQIVANIKVWFDGGREAWVQNVLYNPSNDAIPNTWKWPQEKVK